MLTILLLIAFNLAVGYTLALYVHRPDLLPLPWHLLPLPQISLPTAPTEFPTFTADPQPPAEAASETPLIPVAGEIDKSSAGPTSLDGSSIAAKLKAFQEEAERHRSEIDKIDERLRENSDQPTDEQVRNCIDDLETANCRYLTQQETHIAGLQAHQETGDDAVVAPSLAASQQYTAAVQSTRADLAVAAQLADAAAACREFLKTTGKLAAVNHALVGELEQSAERAAVVVPADELLTGKRVPIAATTASELSPQFNLESAVRGFLQHHATLSGKFSVALAEVDELAAINERHGRAVGDRLLQSIVKMFVSHTPRSTAATHLEAQQFLYFLPDRGARDATAVVEHLRQQITGTEFTFAAEKLQVTVTCGVVEAEFSESPPAILARLQATLHEAQRYGRNRTFFHEGQHPAPAIPPTVAVESRAIAI